MDYVRNLILGPTLGSGFNFKLRALSMDPLICTSNPIHPKQTKAQIRGPYFESMTNNTHDLEFRVEGPSLPHAMKMTRYLEITGKSNWTKS